MLALTCSERPVRSPTGPAAPWHRPSGSPAVGPAHLGCPSPPAASGAQLQALERSGLRREGRGHRRPLHGSTAPRRRALARREEPDPGSGTHPPEPTRNARSPRDPDPRLHPHGTTTLFAALDVLEGTVIGRCMQRHRHEEFLRFLNTIEAAVRPAN